MTGLGATRRGVVLIGFAIFETRFEAFAFVAALTGRFGADFFVVAALAAFCARALPAGERLVAGLSRVDFNTRFARLADFDDERNVERDDSLFSGLLIFRTIGNGNSNNPRLNSGAA
jgi:hypothetical protein